MSRALETEQVGTDGRNATGSEPQNHPHPGRGEGGAAGWRRRRDEAQRWTLMDDAENAEQYRQLGYEVQPLFAAPTTYGKGNHVVGVTDMVAEREDLRRRVDEIRAEHLRLASWNKGKDRPKRTAFHHDAALTLSEVLQALQPIGGRRG